VTYQHILYEVREKIATVTLHRPDRMNAWTPIMERDVRHAMEAAAADDDVRVIVLTGSGRAFCAGADMESLKGLDPGDIKRAESVPPFDMNRRPDWQTRYAYYPSIPKPVIGMLNGATAGIGLVHALYCDLRFAADNTVFTTAFSRRGLIAEHGISWMLPRIVGHANALDLLMSARRVQKRRGAAHRARQPSVSARSAARADLCVCARSGRLRLAERNRRHQAAALRCAVPDLGRSDHRRQPGDGGGAARQRFSRRRGEFHGEAAAKIYGEVKEVPELQRESLRLPRPVVALRAMPGTLRLWLSWLRHA
jgi:enoyl-CoA hydratase/carnithine racemase